jgi:uncharacterized membrane protein HdeD (DUF308 family)
VHWKILLLNGVATFALGLLLLLGLPMTGLVGPGMLVGVDLLMTGVTALSFGFATRRAYRDREWHREPLNTM